MPNCAMLLSDSTLVSQAPVPTTTREAGMQGRGSLPGFWGVPKFSHSSGRARGEEE